MISYSTQALLNYGLISLPANFMHYSIIEKNNWLRQTIDRMKKSAIPVMGISISKEQLNYVDKNFLLYIKKFIKNKYLAINVSQSGLFTNEEFEKVAKIRDSVQIMGSELIFSELSAYYEFEKVCEANSKINSWAEQINNLKIDGKELSPLEKF